MTPRELDELATAIEQSQPNEAWVLLVRYGLPANERAALLDEIELVCDELRRRGHTSEVTSRRVPDTGEAYAVTIGRPMT